MWGKQPEYRFDGFTLDVRRQSLTDPGGKPVHLSSRAFDTLKVLLKHQGETLSKTQLMTTVWPDTVVEENNLNQAIHAIRRALGDSKQSSRFIKTIAGRGYCFVAPVNTTLFVNEASPDSVSGIPAQSLLSRLKLLGGNKHYGLGLCLLFAVTGILLLILLQSPLPVSVAGTVVAGDPVPFTQVTNNTHGDAIAVLPFSVEAPNKAQQIFTVGLHDEVISQLSKIRSLKVIARNSILTLVNQGYSTTKIAELLNIGSYVSGTIQFSGEKARINLNMHDASSGITRWSGNYEVGKGDLAEMFSTQSRIAIDLAQALEAEILQLEQESLSEIPTTSVDAYRYYLSALIAHYKQDFENVWRWSKQAIELDPNFYDAQAAFALVNTILISNPLSGMNSKQHFRLALDSAEKLLLLDPQNSKGYALKASALSTVGDWGGVYNIVDGLMQMEAPLSNLNTIAFVMLSTGDFDKAIEIYRANLQTEPLNLFGRGFLMVALELAGRREESREEYLTGEKLTQVWWGDIVNIFLALGRKEKIPDIDDLPGVTEAYKLLLKKVNRKEDIRPDLYKYRQLDNKVSSEATHYAALAAYSGEHKLAVEFMKSALKDNLSAVFWAWLPVFDETRKLDAFRALLVEAGLVDHWQKHGWTEVCRPIGDSFSCNWTAYQGSTGQPRPAGYP